MLFYANGSKEKNGIVPIMGRVTINGTVAQFSCKRSIVKELWDAKGNRAKGKSVEARETNLALDNIKAQIIKHYQRISDREAYVTAEMVRKHQREESFLKSIIRKAKKWFPLFQELVYMERFCLKVGFNERQSATLISGKPLFYEGELYSEEHRRKSTIEKTGFQVVKDPKDKSKLALAINGQLIGEWFKKRFDKLFSSIKQTITQPREGRSLRL